MVVATVSGPLNFTSTIATSGMDIYNSPVNESLVSSSDFMFSYTSLMTTAEHSYFRNDSAGDDAAVSLAANFYMKMLYLTVGIIGMIGNLLVIVTIFSFRELRRRLPNMFILNQSMLDCTAGFFLVVTTLFNDITVIKSAIGKEVFCRLWLTTLPTWGVFLSSTYNLVAVTVERYMAIVYPLSHSHRFTRKRAYIVMCSVFTVWPNKATQSAVGIVTVLVQYFIPLALVSFCYGRIASVLSSEDSITSGAAGAGAATRNERAATARRNVIKILAMVSVCFVACWSANQIYFGMYNLGFQVDFNGYFYHFTVICVFLNCCVNPFVYALKYDQFQVALQALFCRKTQQKGDFVSVTRTTGTVENSGSNAALSTPCDAVISVNTIVAPPGVHKTASVQLNEVVAEHAGVSSSNTTRF
ncbi:hypothetical protein NP493_206g03005 [Ridgeia piscesae]|uniref:G-protein coupled receptors family 1 profile domain-containing protein n=1 Tax=Ridgeia piscesae TaxID=27915 RepID=A0AAD9P178_RIDPI|nr:hypothetical protein NP493_206g03005 [Ridgeia piscesae]